MTTNARRRGDPAPDRVQPRRAIRRRRGDGKPYIQRSARHSISTGARRQGQLTDRAAVHEAGQWLAMPRFHRCVGVGLNTQLANRRRWPVWVRSEDKQRNHHGARDKSPRDSGERQGQTPGPGPRYRRRQGLGRARHPFNILVERLARRDHRSGWVDLRPGIGAGLAQPGLIGAPPDLFIDGAGVVSHPLKLVADVGHERGDAR